MLRKLMSLFVRLARRLRNYTAGQYYWWLHLKNLYGYLEKKLLFVLIQLLDPDHGATERRLEDLERNSDTLFIMGSGASVNEISDAGWETMDETGDVLSFNYFFRGDFVPIDYHIVREIECVPTLWGGSMLANQQKLSEYCAGLHQNDSYDETKFFVLWDDISWNARGSAYSGWLTFALNCFRNREICFFQTSKRELPGEDMSEISHYGGTLTDAINIGYLLGYDDIVLVGVDLYNRDYFWLDDGEGRSMDEQYDRDIESEHNTAPTMVRLMPSWEQFLADHGVSVYVENPRSLLHTEADTPVYDLLDQ